MIRVGRDALVLHLTAVCDELGEISPIEHIEESFECLNGCRFNSSLLILINMMDEIV